MSKPFFPDISLYQELVPFLRDFYFLNKSKNKKFSYQYLANKLDWSAPYLNDIFKGRKRLSLNRAMQFIQLLELKGAAAERFLILFLSDSDKDFALSPLKKEALASSNTSIKESTFSLERTKESGGSIDFLLMMYIHYNKGKWNAQKFLDELTFKNKPSIEAVESLLKRLIKKKLISFELKSNLYTVIQQQHVVLHSEAAQKNEAEVLNEIYAATKEYGHSFLNYMQNPIPGKSTFVVGTVSLKPEMYQDVRSRIRALHNYLMELSLKTQEEFDKDPNALATAQNRVWQYQLNLFSTFEDQENK